MNILLPLLPTARQLLCLAFIIFKLFGFIPFPFDCYKFELTPARCDCWSLIRPLLNLLFYIALHTVVMINGHSIFFTELQILSMNDILKFAAQMIVIYAILINIVLQRGVHRSFWVKVDVVRRLALRRFTRAFIRWYLWKFYGYVAFSFIVELAVHFRIQRTPADTANYWVILALHVFLRFRHLFHMFFIDLLKVHLRQLHYGLEEVTQYVGELQSIPNDSPRYCTVYRRSVDRLLQLKTIYGHLWDINDCINRTFGWSQICNFTANFVQLSCDLYRCYLATQGFSFDGCKDIFLTLVPSSCLIVLLLNAAESCLREGSCIGTALLDVPTVNDPTLRKIVYRFGLQVSQQRIHLTAHGLFDINYTLLKMFGTGITTYMVIFITFSKGIKFQQMDEELE